MTSTSRRLRTPRLLLRPVESGDVDFLEAHWNAPGVRRYLWDDEAVARATVEAVVGRSEEHFSTLGYGLWALCVPGQPSPVGVCGLRPIEGRELVEVVYSLEPAYWGRGLATEAARGVLARGFGVGLERIVGGADEENAASRRVLERLGMRFSERLSVEGRLVPYYAVLRDGFAAPRGPGWSIPAGTPRGSRDAPTGTNPPDDVGR